MPCVAECHGGLLVPTHVYRISFVLAPSAAFPSPLIAVTSRGCLRTARDGRLVDNALDILFLRRLSFHTSLFHFQVWLSTGYHFIVLSCLTSHFIRLVCLSSICCLVSQCFLMLQSIPCCLGSDTHNYLVAFERLVGGYKFINSCSAGPSNVYST